MAGNRSHRIPRPLSHSQGRRPLSATPGKPRDAGKRPEVPLAGEAALLPPALGEPGSSRSPLRPRRRRRLPEPFGPCPAPVAPLLQQVVLVLSPDSGRSRHPRTSSHAPAPQPTEKINKPPRAAAGARPRPLPAPPRPAALTPPPLSGLPSRSGLAAASPRPSPQPAAALPAAVRPARRPWAR